MIDYLKSYLAKEEGVDLGAIEGRWFAREKLTEAELNHHVHVVGASGYGKSVLLSHILKDAIKRGKGVLFIDLKADLETIEDVKRYADQANRSQDLRFFSLSNPSLSSPYNLVGSGTPTQLRDRIMTSLTWSEEYYKSVAASFLLKILMGLCWLRDEARQKFTLKDIQSTTQDLGAIKDLLERLADAPINVREVIEQNYFFLKEKDGFQSLQGLRSQLESILLSQFGSLVSDIGGNASDLFNAVRTGQIIYILLDSRRYGETAKAVGKFILQDLKAVSARIDSEIRKEDRIPFQVLIDEFADFATEDFVSFLDRARSSKVSVVLAHQELSDLKRISLEFASRLSGNMSTMYAFLQKNRE